MKKICVVTATRAEYGLLTNVIKRIAEAPDLELCLVVTGAHLSSDYGSTVHEIEQSGLPIAERIPILEEPDGQKSFLPGEEWQRSDGPKHICLAMGRAAARFGEMYARQTPDLLVVLGDRYELLPICASALQFKIPIAHISGGEVTRGVLDDVHRHCITKMSHLHFPACEAYRRRIIQLGEEPKRVFCYGDVGVEQIMTMDFLEKEELMERVGLPPDIPYACVTFHPVVMEKTGVAAQVREVLSAFEEFPDMNFLITKANADAGGRQINELIDAYTGRHANWRCFYSLGNQAYLSALKYAEMVIGNSSSGIVEAPCFHIPTVNIGSRQDGRLMAESIISCAPDKEAVAAAIRRAGSPEFREIAGRAVNPYGAGDTSCRIVEEIRRYLKAPEFRKTFYDVDWRETE